MKNKLLVAIVLLITFVSVQLKAPTPAHACSCVGPLTAKETLERSDAVFFGKVVSIKEAFDPSYSPTSIEVTLEVISMWKGVSTGQVTIYTGRGGGDCGKTFTVGELTLVYAMGGDDKQLYTGSCNYYRPQNARMDLEELGPGSPPLSQEVLQEQARLHQREAAGSGAIGVTPGFTPYLLLAMLVQIPALALFVLLLTQQ